MYFSRRRSFWLAALGALSLATGCQAPLNTATAPAQSSVSKTTYQIAGKATTTRYLVSFTGDEVPANAAALVSAAGGTLDQALPGGVAIASSKQAGFAQALAKDPSVESVGVSSRQGLTGNRYAAAFSLQADGANASGASGEPLSGYQWGIETTNTPAAWAQGLTGAGVKVAVLDTGIDEKNPDLAPNLDLARSRSFVAHEPSVVDYNGHGSHVAGIIAAAQNGYGVSGVAPGASYFSVKVLDASGWGEDADILKGIVYAADQGARIINMSLEGPAADQAQVNAYRHAIRYAKKKGAIVVAAAGNESGSPKSLGAYLLPAEVEACIAVSAVGPQNQQNFDTFSLFSNYGQFVDIAAPGGNLGFDPATYQPIIYSKQDFVLSTWSTQGRSYTSNGFKFSKASHLYLAGTSQATPHVAGALALMLQAHPGLTPAQARQRLLTAADDVGQPGRDAYYGRGRLNTAAAL